jgi:hypothetical protein
MIVVWDCSLMSGSPLLPAERCSPCRELCLIDLTASEALAQNLFRLVMSGLTRLSRRGWEGTSK